MLIVVPCREPVIKNAEISTVKIFSHIQYVRMGCASSVPADVGPGPPVPASLAAPHISAIDYEGPITSVATFRVSVDVASTKNPKIISSLLSLGYFVR